MEGRGKDKHPWQDDAFLLEQMDYIVDRLLTAMRIYTFVTKHRTSSLTEKEDKLRSLYIACSEVNKGEEKVRRSFHGKFTRILKLLTDAYCEAIGQEENDLRQSPSDTQHMSPSPKLSHVKHSTRASSPSFLRRSLKSSNHSLEIVHRINADFERHHYARLLGLMLGEIYRLMDADVLPSIRDTDKQKKYYQNALLTQLPITATSNDECDPININSWYSHLKLRTEPPMPEKPLSTHGKIK